MRTNWTGYVLIAATLVVGCSADTQERALGITTLEVAETPTSLSIVGVDHAGSLIASLRLGVGPFVMTDDGRDANGRQMTISVLGVTASHESDGMEPLTLPALKGEMLASLNVFLQDPEVARALARWDVRVEPPPATTESPYDWWTLPTPCSGCTAARCNGGANDCGAMYGAGSEEQLVCCLNTKNFAHRNCTGYPSTNSCGTVGTNGCSVCWLAAWESYCVIYNDQEGIYCIGEYD